MVDDSPEDVELMLRALRKHNFANRVHVAEDGEEALKYLLSVCQGAGDPLKVVFLDLKLPKVSGIEVLRSIRSNPLTRHLPVVIVTSSQEEPDLKECYRLGANSYVVKPVEFDTFSKAISDLGFYWLILNKPPLQVEVK